jgi:hypothetical protein
VLCTLAITKAVSHVLNVKFVRTFSSCSLEKNSSCAHGWEDNIKVDLLEIGCEEVVYNKVQWLALMNAIVKLWVV